MEYFRIYILLFFNPLLYAVVVDRMDEIRICEHKHLGLYLGYMEFFRIYITNFHPLVAGVAGA